MDLEDGQAWDDTLTLTLSRQDAFMALAAMSVMFGNIKDGVEQVKDAARDGDIVAVLIGPHLVESGRDMQHAMREMTRQLLPALWAEVEAVDAAEAAEAANHSK